MTAPPSGSDATPFQLRGEHITLDALLKATGLVGSGGHAKLLITSGDVLVDGSPETRRGRKLRGGERVSVQDHSFLIQAETPLPG
ncbi:MAG TPA: RNA-binding S4 domain-containing protein [Myxococcota bacterium]|nr:RNA-binding S4 domain-containing protein [Myxococcota bacterium]